MIKQHKLYIVIGCFVVLLVSNIYFIVESNKPHYPVVIGKPIDEERTTIGEPIKNKADVGELFFTLMHAKSIDEPEISSQLPDATIWINDWDVGVAYIVTDVWFEEGRTIFGFGGKDNIYGTHYKEDKGSGVEAIQAMIRAYQP